MTGSKGRVLGLATAAVSVAYWPLGQIGRLWSHIAAETSTREALRDLLNNGRTWEWGLAMVVKMAVEFFVALAFAGLVVLVMKFLTTGGRMQFTTPFLSRSAGAVPPDQAWVALSLTFYVGVTNCWLSEGGDDPV